jgi:hypothetical protein
MLCRGKLPEPLSDVPAKLLSERLNVRPRDPHALAFAGKVIAVNLEREEVI